MKDVAALAGVAVGTVSNVLNAPDRVAATTRQRVEDAIEKLGWVPNESARQLRAGYSRIVGLVVMDLGNPFFTDIAAGVDDHVQEHGFSVQIGNSAQNPARERTHLQLFEQHRVRGLLFAPIADAGAAMADLRRRGVPVVLVDRADSAMSCCSVSVDDVEGGRLAVAHLIDQGHRRIAFVGGPSDLRQIHDRRLGTDIAVSQSRLDVDVLVISTPKLDVASGVAAAGEIAVLDDAERPTAVFAANDLLAIGLLQGFVTHGLRVPEEVAIIGYDDIAFAAAAAVPLSSIRQPREAMGRRAAELLFAEIAAVDDHTPHDHEHVRFTPELIVRRSTAGRPARSAD